MRRILFGLALACFAAQLPLPAQEPAWFAGNASVRFEQSPGVFHVLYPCDTGREFTHPLQIASKAPGPSEAALCWPAAVVRMTRNGTTITPSPAATGRLLISRHNLLFLPNLDKDVDVLAIFQPADIRFEHRPGDAVALFGTKDLLYRINFANFCLSCIPGPAPPPANPAQLDQEFALVKESLDHFDTALERVRGLSSRIRIDIRPTNQPTPTDIPESFALYSAINSKFAGLCPEPAKSCVQAFARFQACKSASATADCGPAPSCSDQCVIASQDLRALNAGACIQPDQQGASLTPDWTAAVKTRNPAANPPPRPFTPGLVEPQMTPGPTPPSGVGCGVNASFVRAGLATFGVAGLEGLGGSGGVIGGPIQPAGKVPANAAAPKKVMISANVAQGMILKKVAPLYPPVAQAARVSGIVVLQAIISKEGTIDDLKVIAGPALLQSAALDAVKQWQYKPFLLNGQPVAVETTVNVIFQLGAPSPPPPATSAPASH